MINDLIFTEQINRMTATFAYTMHPKQFAELYKQLKDRMSDKAFEAVAEYLIRSFIPRPHCRFPFPAMFTEAIKCIPSNDNWVNPCETEDLCDPDVQAAVLKTMRLAMELKESCQYAIFNERIVKVNKEYNLDRQNKKEWMLAECAEIQVEMSKLPKAEKPNVNPLPKAIPGSMQRKQKNDPQPITADDMPF